jgi:hypothetical protein
MRSICIVGAGQAGLQLAIGLLGHGYDVTLVADRPAAAIRDGRVMSSQCMFGTPLAYESDLGLNFWDGDAPAVDGIAVAVADPSGAAAPAISWAGRLDTPARSVDLRVKIPRWMAEFNRRGGRLIVHEAGLADLAAYHREHDLVVVAAGKGEISTLFDRDADRSPHVRPARSLALAYVTGRTPGEWPRVSFNLVPGVGEFCAIPALTATGPCDILFLEGVPGGPFDAFGDVREPGAHLTRTLDLLRAYVPWEADRVKNVALTDDLAVLSGRFTPVVRRPVGVLPSGGLVLGMADTVVLNDPISGQGSNNAARFAHSYLASIVAHGDRPFDREFMAEAFLTCWDYVREVTDWTNALLARPPAHVLRLLAAAADHPDIAHRFVNGFDNPADFRTWFLDAEGAERYLADQR